jgi:GNAT superfamily N-acetyltransferase
MRRFEADDQRTMISVALETKKRDVAPSVRRVEPADVLRVVHLNHAAYPDLVGDNIVLTEAQIRAHLEVFPRGQRIAEIDGVAVGGVSTFIVARTVDPLRLHSWLGITDEGYFRSHDPGGDTLYLADIFVDPAAWGRGVGTALYATLREICAEHGLRRIVAGGRLFSYHEHAHELTPGTYIEEVIAKRIFDRVLRSQLKAGYVVRGILPEYLPDRRSRNYATLLEWTRPTHASVPPPR